jgi:hypothetical protein
VGGGGGGGFPLAKEVFTQIIIPTQMAKTGEYETVSDIVEAAMPFFLI